MKGKVMNNMLNEGQSDEMVLEPTVGEVSVGHTGRNLRKHEQKSSVQGNSAQFKLLSWPPVYPKRLPEGIIWSRTESDVE